MYDFAFRMRSSKSSGTKDRQAVRARLGHLACAIGAIGFLAFAAVPVSAGTTSAQHPEQSLLGVKIFERATQVLKKFGNPTKVETGTTSPAPAVGVAPIAPIATGALPPLPTPGGPGGTAPEFGGAPAAQPAQANGASAVPPSQVIYEYAGKNNITIDFTISSDGRVIQISVSGVKDSGVVTSRGVTLGTPYTAVLAKYGYPEIQDTANAILTARYTEKSHVAFQFYNNKVVSITVAAVE
ncbi:MAG: hypothetical protein P4L33_01865 [Capsulimonadaceae bacterium]|nr:hypothetical protein [Capsulimonadaceae bacterium]